MENNTTFNMDDELSLNIERIMKAAARSKVSVVAVCAYITHVIEFAHKLGETYEDALANFMEDIDHYSFVVHSLNKAGALYLAEKVSEISPFFTDDVLEEVKTEIIENENFKFYKDFEKLNIDGVSFTAPYFDMAVTAIFE